MGKEIDLLQQAREERDRMFHSLCDAKDKIGELEEDLKYFKWYFNAYGKKCQQIEELKTLIPKKVEYYRLENTMPEWQGKPFYA